MTLSVDELIAPSTPDEVKASIYDALAILELPVTTWLPGDPIRTVIAVESTLLAAYTQLAALFAQSAFLETATGGWLTVVARQVYGVERIEATFAEGVLTLTNAGGGIFSFDPGEVVAKNSTTGETYTNAEAFALAALGTADVLFRANDAGTAGNAAATQIDTLVTTLAAVTCSNAAAFTGLDAESDAELRARCLAAVGALSPNGPSAAYEYVAQTPALNGGVSVTRVRVLPPPGDGTLTVLIAGPDGPTSSPEVALVQAGIDANATPITVEAAVASAAGAAISYDVTLYVKASAGISDPDWTTMAKDTLVAWVKTLPIGGVDLGGGGIVPFRAAIGVLEAMNANVIQASLAVEFDILLAPNEVATLVAGAVTVAVVQVT